MIQVYHNKGQEVYLAKRGRMGDRLTDFLVGTPSTKKVDTKYHLSKIKKIGKMYQQVLNYGVCRRHQHKENPTKY